MSAANPLFVASPSTLAEVVEQLPALERAQLAWAPKRVAELLRPLLMEPSFTDAKIDTAVDTYLETMRALVQPTIRLIAQADVSAAIRAASAKNTELLRQLPEPLWRAATRAEFTHQVVGRLGEKVAVALDAATIDRALESGLESKVLARVSVLLLAVFEGIRNGSPNPGRVFALARRADEAARAFADELASLGIRLPWYFEDAPGAERYARIASWRVEPAVPRREPTKEEVEAWEKVKEGVDSMRPHRKVFS